MLEPLQIDVDNSVNYQRFTNSLAAYEKAFPKKITPYYS